MMTTDEQYMRRAMELARHGELDASPNPMVGCVIVSSNGRVIGEGFHRKCGEGHAEVNAVASVANPSELRGATAYVTLEPCSHYGKTPPCAKLLIDNGLGRVVIGSGDPNEKVNGRGVRMLREAGIEVTEGVLADECRALNPKFMLAFTAGRPYVTLKWAQSTDGYMDIKRETAAPAYRFSTPTGRALVHRLRATHDAIMVGSGTDRADRPGLTTRHWAGESPRRIVAHNITDLEAYLRQLRAEGVTSLLVEGGPTLLQSFISSGLWDTARVEVAPVTLGERGAAPAPILPCTPAEAADIDGNMIYTYVNHHSVHPVTPNHHRNA
ncbi:MAG: bifunctional diaminohydroxyphosphoribosylaminopyrimidine deaminase/5-amino-6-(5-phosphoribosylamino)uracil reductase RibD [Candidatus Amulumruptor caecigallinarius]|nr:bifunctional diaminohydroxyphosphoribosylaminopyrimidine deaminase/5-amino-6-(5-phosphoribosylamino)uracil reductase RibD [Candidatus Amulumruptor caecigallinarius]MCM1396490.1 bifunctional diaminohydroxyphosphoribosylaminopyrimidine deaminase/5-amino-6-(5-phosphoribosylamino)uracil reductase RibD [Candidatus Amulumruptor caecigallinarius]MCM1453453.1 bifunctional diaminohydroxyphosphoribosylaminopyrimidine deaminase/5-amino-6-(5-phosphoribosylamino)uracil reductase RibD [bacterium]